MYIRSTVLATSNDFILQPSKAEIKSGHWAVIGKFADQVPVLEFGLLVLVAKQEPVLLTFSDGVRKVGL
jgi:hypothetical protein